MTKRQTRIDTTKAELNSTFAKKVEEGWKKARNRVIHPNQEQELRKVGEVLNLDDEVEQFISSRPTMGEASEELQKLWKVRDRLKSRILNS